MTRLMMLVVFVAVSLLPAMAQGAAICTNETLAGTYGFQEQGQSIAEGYSEFRTVGLFTFDGKGNASMKYTTWYSNFLVTGGQIALSYHVEPDCTFTSTYVENGESFSGVIVNKGRELRYLETSGDPMRSGQAVKVK